MQKEYWALKFCCHKIYFEINLNNYLPAIFWMPRILKASFGPFTVFDNQKTLWLHWGNIFWKKNSFSHKFCWFVYYITELFPTKIYLSNTQSFCWMEALWSFFMFSERNSFFNGFYGFINVFSESWIVFSWFTCIWYLFCSLMTAYQ